MEEKFPPSSDLYAFCERLAEATGQNLVVLQRRSHDDDLDFVLSAWTFVLGNSALDTFRGIVDGSRRQSRTATIVLQRALFEYRVRLRYYLVQAKPCYDSHRRRAIPRQHLVEQVHAFNDFEERDFALGRNLVEYAPEFWADDARDRLQAFHDRPDDFDFTSRSPKQMLDFLLQHEGRIRGILVERDRTSVDEADYAFGEWASASVHAHGHQGVVSEYVDVERLDYRTLHSTLLRESNLTITLFSAILHLIGVNESIAIRQNGFALGTHGAFLESSRLWRSHDVPSRPGAR